MLADLRSNEGIHVWPELPPGPYVDETMAGVRYELARTNEPGVIDVRIQARVQGVDAVVLFQRGDRTWGWTAPMLDRRGRPVHECASQAAGELVALYRDETKPGTRPAFIDDGSVIWLLPPEREPVTATAPYGA